MSDPLKPNYEGLKRIAADFMKAIPDCTTIEELDNGWKCFGIAYLGCKYEHEYERVMAPALLEFVMRRYHKAEREFLLGEQND